MVPTTIHDLGKTIGILLMIGAVAVLIYFLVADKPPVELWEVVSLFWFGSSLFWEASYYKRLTYPENQRT